MARWCVVVVKNCSWSLFTFRSSWSATGRSYWRNTALLQSTIDREVWRVYYLCCI